VGVVPAKVMSDLDEALRLHLALKGSRTKFVLMSLRVSSRVEVACDV
jgi:hypothetical protein